ncbi:SGNH/GDSL hydrolase family protein [Laceyella putida]|uniref:SGNH/GDSL hydrolase family protein n=1 Tax=Laceyella putida TaxID=110101 RepID=A0ABW2RJV9_9BACL
MPERTKPVSYLALGDSLTEGIGAESPTKNFVAQYFQHLRHSDKCHMRNWGVSGMTSKELLNLVKNPGLQRLFPELTHVSVTTGGCDFIDLYRNGTLSLPNLYMTSRRVVDHVKHILSIFRVNNPESNIVLLGFYIPPPAYELGFQTASTLVQWMNSTYEKICQKFGCQFLNPYETFLHRQDYFCDEVHPNQQGYDELAKLIIQS